MKILIIAQHFWPEDVSGAVLATQLAEDLTANGLEVTFLTSAPSYPEGEVFEGFKNKLFSVENYKDVRIIRTWSYITKSKSFFARTLNFLTFSVCSFFAGLFAGSFEIIFSYSPPLTLGIAAWLLSRVKRASWILRVEDLFPDAAIATGVITNKTLIKLLYSLEKFLYKKAAHISLISEEFRRILLAKGGIDPKMLSVTPVWADPNELRNCVSSSNLIDGLDLKGKFIILYSGNIGTTSRLEDIIQAAEILQSHDKIKFLLVGEGVKKQEILNMVVEKNLENVLILPFQDRVTYWEMMKSADLGLVTINQQSASYSLPSKTFNIMASRCPILSVAPENSEVANLVKAHQCGINVVPGNVSELVEKIESLFKDQERLILMGNNGYSAMEKFYSRAVCIQQIHERIKEIYCEANAD